MERWNNAKNFVGFFVFVLGVFFVFVFVFSKFE